MLLLKLKTLNQMNHTLNEIKTLIIEKLDDNISLEDIHDTESLLEDGLGLDSISLINLIVALESHFNIKFSEEDMLLENFSNLKSLSIIIEEKKNNPYD